MKMNYSNQEWVDIRNLTPTFEITPVEKPDLSPFLVHMTGRDSLTKILSCEGLENKKQGYGFLKSSIPTYNGSDGIKGYNQPVVCFTESPVFALDFFRFRSRKRWDEDQQFGIGFSKAQLIKEMGVRPVIYLDSNDNTIMNNFIHRLQKNEIILTNANGQRETGFYGIFDRIFPLLFPLLETKSLQGFMWEREWRSPDKNGLLFSHKDIKIICCPVEERTEIEKILENELNHITIVDSWKEYNEVTDYLKSRSNIIENDRVDTLTEILSLKQNLDSIINTLNCYSEFLHTISSKSSSLNIEEIITELKQKSETLEKEIKKASSKSSR